MRSTPHQDPADAAADAADTASKKFDAAADTASQKLGDAADAASKKFDGAANAATQKLDDTVDQGKEWLQSLDLQSVVDQIPQPLRDLGTQLVERVRRLSPTQQIVGGAVLAFGVGLLATSGSRNARTADAKAGKKYRAKYD